MKETWENFSRYLDKDSFAQAFTLKKELQDSKYTDEDLSLLVHTKSIYQKQFQFEDIAKFDYSVEQFDKIDAAEENLNGNIENQKLLDTYIQTCHDVAKNLIVKYGE